jgi:cobalt-zinc-cadmium efflux system outer membrane protein
MKTTTFIAALLACCVVVLLHDRSYAQQSIDFAKALELARNTNPDWKSAEQEVEIARGKVTTARLISPFNPVLEGQGGRRSSPEKSGADYGVGLSMELEVAGQRGLRIGEADRNLQKAEAAFKDFSRNFTARLARAFYQALFMRERLTLLQRVENLNLRLLEVTRAKYQAGDVSGLEINVASVRYGRARKDSLDGRRDQQSALADLRRLIGGDEPIQPAGELVLAAPPVSVQEIAERARANRPDLLAKRREVERAEAEVALRQRESLPNPTLGVFFNREASGDKIVLGGLSIPLPIFNRHQGEIASLHARTTQARAELLALEKDIRKEAEQAVNEWSSGLESHQLFQKEIVASMEENFKLLEAAYRERKIDFPQALIMENDLVAANLSYLETALKLREAAIKLQQVTGEVR